MSARVFWDVCGSNTESRVERYFPLRNGDPAPVLLLNPALGSGVPPLDLLKLSTFLRKRGYTPVLRSTCFDITQAEPFMVVLTSVFSWYVPCLRRLISLVHVSWPRARTLLTGVLPRRLGDRAQSQFGVLVLDESSEVLLDGEPPDYSLVPEWDASIVITSKGVCPRECSHCETAARGKGVTKLVSNWPSQLNPVLPRVELWDNTVMLTPREHFSSVARQLGATEKPVDFVCGLAPGGVEEAELRWRISQLADVRVLPARLECNLTEDLPRFRRLLAHTRSVFGDSSRYRAFAVINGWENPLEARDRVRQMEATGVDVDVVCYTPHDWEESKPYINTDMGWTQADVESFKCRSPLSCSH